MTLKVSVCPNMPKGVFSAAAQAVSATDLVSTSSRTLRVAAFLPRQDGPIVEPQCTEIDTNGEARLPQMEVSVNTRCPAAAPGEMHVVVTTEGEGGNAGVKDMPRVGSQMQVASFGVDLAQVCDGRAKVLMVNSKAPENDVGMRLMLSVGACEPEQHHLDTLKEITSAHMSTAAHADVLEQCRAERMQKIKDAAKLISGAKAANAFAKSSYTVPFGVGGCAKPLALEHLDLISHSLARNFAELESGCPYATQWYAGMTRALAETLHSQGLDPTVQNLKKLVTACENDKVERKNLFHSFASGCVQHYTDHSVYQGDTAVKGAQQLSAGASLCMKPGENQNLAGLRQVLTAHAQADLLSSLRTGSPEHTDALCQSAMLQSDCEDGARRFSTGTLALMHASRSAISSSCAQVAEAVGSHSSTSEIHNLIVSGLYCVRDHLLTSSETPATMMCFAKAGIASDAGGANAFEASEAASASEVYSGIQANLGKLTGHAVGVVLDHNNDTVTLSNGVQLSSASISHICECTAPTAFDSSVGYGHVTLHTGANSKYAQVNNKTVDTTTALNVGKEIACKEAAEHLPHAYVSATHLSNISADSFYQVGISADGGLLLTATADGLADALGAIKSMTSGDLVDDDMLHYVASGALDEHLAEQHLLLSHAISQAPFSKKNLRRLHTEVEKISNTIDTAAGEGLMGKLKNAVSSNRNQTIQDKRGPMENFQDPRARYEFVQRPREEYRLAPSKQFSDKPSAPLNVPAVIEYNRALEKVMALLNGNDADLNELLAELKRIQEAATALKKLKESVRTSLLGIQKESNKIMGEDKLGKYLGGTQQLKRRVDQAKHTMQQIQVEDAFIGSGAKNTYEDGYGNPARPYAVGGGTYMRRRNPGLSETDIDDLLEGRRAPINASMTNSRAGRTRPMEAENSSAFNPYNQSNEYAKMRSTMVNERAQPHPVLDLLTSGACPQEAGVQIRPLANIAANAKTLTADPDVNGRFHSAAVVPASRALVKLSVLPSEQELTSCAAIAAGMVNTYEDLPMQLATLSKAGFQLTPFHQVVSSAAPDAAPVDHKLQTTLTVHRPLLPFCSAAEQKNLTEHNARVAYARSQNAAKLTSTSSLAFSIVTAA